MGSNSEKVVVIVALNTRIAALHERSSQTHQLVRPRDGGGYKTGRNPHARLNHKGKDVLSPDVMDPEGERWNQGQMA